LIFLIIISFLSKFVGFGREVFLSHYYGAGSISDAYLISLTIPVVICAIIGNSISTGYIPIYNKVSSTRGIDEGNKFTNNLINSILILTTFFVFFGFFFTKQIVHIFAMGFNNETLKLAILFTKISLFSMYFIIINSVLTGFLQTKEKYIYPALVGFLSNGVVIFSIVIGFYTNNVILAYGSVISALFQTIFLLINSYREGYRYRFVVEIFNNDVKEIIKMATPLFIGLSASQINIIIDKSIASSVSIGGISALNYADRLNSFVLSSLVMSISAILYPNLSKNYASGNIVEYKRVISNSVTLILIILIPTTFITYIYSEVIVRLVFSGGAFDETAVLMTAKCLSLYSLGIIGMGLKEIFTKVLYSMENTIIPMANSILGIILNILLSIFLSFKFGVYGIAIATSVAANLTMILLFINILKIIEGYNYLEVIIIALKSILISIISGIFSYLCFNYLSNIINYGIALISSLLLFAVLYFIIILFSKITYVDNILIIIKGRFQKM
jgi:putative peptidoglycan lipid II flippase